MSKRDTMWNIRKINLVILHIKYEKMLKIRDNSDKLIGSTFRVVSFKGWLHWKTK